MSRRPGRRGGRRPASRKGMVLVIVLVVVATLALGAYTFSDRMLTERESVQLMGKQIQARALVDSGVDVVRLILAEDEYTRRENGGVYDNPARFQGVVVVDDLDPASRGAFTVLSPAVDDSGFLAGLRYGLEDESARLNLNALLLAESQQEGGGKTLLMALPGMTEETAEAILDWIDEDDEPRPLGAEVGYYSGLPTPYAPKNGPLDTVEELLLVRGVTPEMLFGADVNRNGLLEISEQEFAANAPVDEAAGSLDRGWSAFLTLHSTEANVNAAGLPRVFLNQEDMQALYDQLVAVTGNPTWATFIVAYRMNGPRQSSDEEDEAEKNYSVGGLDLTKQARYPITNALDLIGARVRVKFEGDEENTLLASPFDDRIGAMNIYLPQLMDNVTVNPAPTIPGRININEAPRNLLLGVPGLNEDLVEQIISRRTEIDEENPNRNLETWLLTEALVTKEEMIALSPFLNGGGDVYRGQVVGYYQDGVASSRAEVVISAADLEPRVVFWRDLSHLGRGYAVETLGVDMQIEDGGLQPNNVEQLR